MVQSVKNHLKHSKQITSRWFQPNLKNMIVKLDHFPNFRDENSKHIWVATTQMLNVWCIYLHLPPKTTQM